MTTQILDFLRRRRRELGISYPKLAARTGIAETTLKRMFSPRRSNASFESVCAVASAMGIAVRLEPESTAIDFREKVAEKKAREIVSMVQGTSLLEAQGVPSSHVAKMVKETTHELVAGSNLRLWSL